MRHPFLVYGFFFFFLLPLSLTAQTGEGSSAGTLKPYMIPQIVFVADRGRLAVPLGPAFSEAVPGPQTPPLSQNRDLVIHRIEVEQGNGGRRLLIDFQAFAPGDLELPPIEIGSETISGLSVKVSSILASEGDEGRSLSPPAPAMPVPGTAFLIYGSIFGFFLLLLLTILGGIWTFPWLRKYLVRSRQRRIIRSMERILDRLKAALPPGEGVAALDRILSEFSSEFRIFLGCFAPVNCRSMVPAEFLALPVFSVPGGGDLGDMEEADREILSGPFLHKLFRHSDILRFSGAVVTREAVEGLLDGARSFTSALHRLLLVQPSPPPSQEKNFAGRDL